MTTDSITLISRLTDLADPKRVMGMARFGINSHHTLGVSLVQIRSLAKGIRSHEIALQLWESGIHEARLLASMVDEPQKVSASQMDSWVMDFDSWDVCDGVLMNLFWRTPFAVEKAIAWQQRDEEYVRRAGFVMMAVLAVHQKKEGDDLFLNFLNIIEHNADDPRNFVKKAVNWALRQIGKRNAALGQASLATCYRLIETDSPPARWAARDAIRELEAKWKV